MPDALADALMTERWGLPDVGGWENQQAGRLERMTAAAQVYHAFIGYNRAKDKYDWIAAHPVEYGLVQRYRRNGK